MPCLQNDCSRIQYVYKARGLTWADEASAGNIYMHPALDESLKDKPHTGSNARRGDKLGDIYRESIKDFIARQHELSRLRWDLRNTLD